MTAHDPAERPGAHLVAQHLGTDDPWDLGDHEPVNVPLDSIGSIVAMAAYEVDDLHQTLMRVAYTARDLLAPVSEGRAFNASSHFVALGAAFTQIEHLHAERDRAWQHLTRLLPAYQRLLGATDSHSRYLDAAQHRGQSTQAERKRQTAALEAVAAGGVRLCRTAIGRDPYVAGTDPSQPAIWPATIEQLLADGLLTLDTTATPAVSGQLLSLTDQGHQALRARDMPDTHDPGANSTQAAGPDEAADPRTSAALHRSNRNTRSASSSPTATEPAPPAGPSNAARPTRSR